MTGIVLNMLC